MPADLDFQHDTAAYVELVVQSLPATPTCLERIRTAQNQDPVHAQLKEYCVQGWPAKNKLSKELQPYHVFAGELTVVQDLLMNGNRLVIPPVMQPEILGKLHAGHLGIVKCWDRAKQSVWWIGLCKQVQDIVTNCNICVQQRDNPTEPMIATEPPQRPWESVATDLFQWNGSNYLLVVDYFSRYPEIARLNNTTSHGIIEHMKSIFSRHGIPEVVTSDNGPQYASEQFADFAQAYGFQHKTSSPRYPQSNGEAERSVKTIKGLLTKSKDPYLAVMEYRATPLFNGCSPAQLLMGRRIRTTLPVHPSMLEPQWPDLASVCAKERQYKQQQKANFDRHHNARELPALKQGTEVWVRDMKQTGTVAEKAQTPRSYVIQTEDGMLRRNRRHLVPMGQDQVPPAIPGEAAVALEGGAAANGTGHVGDRGPPAIEQTPDSPVTGAVAPAVTQPRRNPPRVRNTPAYLNDFV